MRLIKSLEVAYFRSLYKQTLNNLDGLTIIFGRNDSGKSNILRALNLFFNSETNPGQPFSFERDFSRSRLNEATARADARKFIYVKVTFNTPTEWQKSLKKEFYVKKQWNISSGTDYQLSFSPHLKKKQQYLSRFLNRIQYHYIPAIKDRSIFEKLLANVYNVLSVDQQFVHSLDNFSNEIQRRTEQLSAGLLQNIGLKSAISAPTNLEDLFRSLDFETSAPEQNDPFSLTLQRGDGIQVRHIPEILKFISDNSRKPYHIWGFEEPENSLELANAIEEARLFRNYGRQRNKQIFVTSHSPAFFNLHGDGMARYYIHLGIAHESTASTVNRLDGEDGNNTMQLMGDTIYLPLISSALARAETELKQLQNAHNGIVLQLQASHRPLLFVEGETDARIVEAAWSSFFPDTPIPFGIEPAGGTTRMRSLAGEGGALKPVIGDRIVCVLVDNDPEGRSVLRNARLDPGGRWVIHSNGVHWCRLKVTDKAKEIYARWGLDPADWPFCIESCFSAALRRRARAEGAYAFDRPHAALLAHQQLSLRLWQPLNQIVDDSDDQYYLISPTVAAKQQFAQWVAAPERRTRENFHAFERIIVGLHDLVQAAAVFAD